MKPCIPEILNRFALAIHRAQNEFNAGPRTPSDWLYYYEEKWIAYDDLCAKLPQIKEISDFWRWVQNSSSQDWPLWTEREIQRINKTAKCPCGVKVNWPKKLCEKCQETKKMKAKEAKITRKAVKKRLKALSRAKKGSRNRRREK